MRPAIFYLLLAGFFIAICTVTYRSDASIALWKLKSATPEKLGASGEASVSAASFDSEDGEDVEFRIHPVDDLVTQADQDFEDLLGRRTKHADAAAKAYRERRDRHPPPAFDRWVAWAEEHNCVVIEDMFDQLYEDLEPFWGLEAKTIREQASSWPVVLTIRGGKVDRKSMIRVGIPDWVGKWKQLLEEIPKDALPDVDLALNPDDEPHLFVPHDAMVKLMDMSAKTRHTNAPTKSNPIYDDYAIYDPLPQGEATFTTFGDTPTKTSIWDLARSACPGGSPARQFSQDEDFGQPALFPQSYAPHTYAGFIANWTAAKSACGNPHLANLHGYFIGAKESSNAQWRNDSRSTYQGDRLLSRHLFPLFSTAKLQGINSDILIPAAVYLDDAPSLAGEFAFLETDAVAWDQKQDKVIWRGGQSGGFNKAETWTRFHRHRFVSMLNATQVRMTESILDAPKPEYVPGGSPELPFNFPWPNKELYPLAALQKTRDLGRWVGTWSSDSAFNRLLCWPIVSLIWTKGRSCYYSGQFYKPVAKHLPMKNFFKYKYLPDLDGHSFSGRWRAYMRSGSLPIKATVWSEWHDSRLIPWRHFVPMDNTFVDFYTIMEYFVGYRPSDTARKLGVKEKRGNDAVARAVAEQGKDWGHRVLRREDMLLYFWRVLLEYARICDDRRQQMGYVEDLE